MLYDCIQQLGRQNKKAPSVAVARRHANAWKDHANGRRHNDVSVELCLSCCEFGVFRAKDCLTLYVSVVAVQISCLSSLSID